jgi:hypothetical protein
MLIYSYQRGKILVNITKVKEFVKKEKHNLKQTKTLRNGHAIYENKPVFVKMVNNYEKKVSDTI